MNQPRGKPFQPGNQFGRGRPKGSRNKATRAAQDLLEQHYQPLLAKQLKAAYDGDAKARQWCLEQFQRLPAPRRKLKLPPLKTLDDLGKASEVIMESVARREITTAEGTELMGMLEQKRKWIETHEVIPRMEELEQIVKSHPR